MGLFHENIICSEQPKMQNKHQFFLVLGVPTYGEGVDLVGTKSQIFPMSLFEGSPYQFVQAVFKQSPVDLIGYHEGDQLMDNHGHLLVDSVHGSTMMNAWEERATEDCCCEHLHILLHILLDIHSPPFHLHILHLFLYTFSTFSLTFLLCILLGIHSSVKIPWHSFLLMQNPIIDMLLQSFTFTPP